MTEQVQLKEKHCGHRGTAGLCAKVMGGSCVPTVKDGIWHEDIASDPTLSKCPDTPRSAWRTFHKRYLVFWPAFISENSRKNDPFNSTCGKAAHVFFLPLFPINPLISVGRSFFINLKLHYPAKCDQSKLHTVFSCRELQMKQTEGHHRLSACGDGIHFGTEALL